MSWFEANAYLSDWFSFGVSLIGLPVVVGTMLAKLKEVKPKLIFNVCIKESFDPLVLAAEGRKVVKDNYTAFYIVPNTNISYTISDIVFEYKTSLTKIERFKSWVFRSPWRAMSPLPDFIYPHFQKRTVSQESPINLHFPSKQFDMKKYFIERLKSIYVTDTVGNEWHVSPKAIKALKKQVKEA